MSSYSTTDFEAECASLRKQLQAAETAQERREVMRAMAALERKSMPKRTKSSRKRRGRQVSSFWVNHVSTLLFDIYL